MKFIRYRDGYKFQLEADYTHQTAIMPAVPGGNGYVDISATGLLTVRAMYAWDGASGPAINTVSILRASLVHDALYQLIRLGHINPADRQQADQALRETALEDGMCKPRAWWVYLAVRKFGGLYLLPGEPETLTAPQP